MKEVRLNEDYENLTIKCVPVGHDHLLNVEALKIIIPELIEFIGRND